MEKFLKEGEGLYRLKIPYDEVYTSVFLLQRKGINVLIDCAAAKGDVEEYILPALAGMGVTPSRIDYLFLTHYHEDHAGGRPYLLRHNPKIKIVESVCDFVDGLEVYPMPGHTLGSIGLLDINSGTLVAGDGLQGDGVGRFRCTYESKEDYVKTLKKIQKDKRIKRILFSHAYEPWRKDVAVGEKEISACLEACLEVVERRL